MALDTSVVGSPTVPSTTVLERTPLSLFAKAVKSTSAIYTNAEVAKANGFAAIPAPPTLAFAWSTFAQFEELQPPEAATMTNPMLAVMGTLRSSGGLILHGEQAFKYHAPVVAGDTLHGTGKVSELYEKTSSTSTMTFVSTETEFRNDQGDLVLTMTTTLIHKA